MLQVAGEVADGVVGHPLTSTRHIEEVVLPSIAEGAARAGRKREEIELAQAVIVSIAPDREVAKREVKQQVGFYATTTAYLPLLALHGFEDLQAGLKEAYAAGDMPRLASLVPDEMADAFAIYGAPDEVRENARRYEGLVDELVLAFPWYRIQPARLMEIMQAVRSTFAADTQRA